jgi:hypothetical protein
MVLVVNYIFFLFCLYVLKHKLQMIRQANKLLCTQLSICIGLHHKTCRQKLKFVSNLNISDNLTDQESILLV